MNITLASKRARTRVQDLLDRDLPWLCGWGRRPACTRITDAEWARVQAVAQQREWRGITVCQRCQDLTTQPQPLTLTDKEG